MILVVIDTMHLFRGLLGPPGYFGGPRCLKDAEQVVTVFIHSTFVIVVHDLVTLTGYQVQTAMLLLNSGYIKSDIWEAQE